VQPVHLRRPGHRRRRYPVHQHVVQVTRKLIGPNAQSARSISLRIKIHNQHLAIPRSQIRSEVYGGGSFANSALLVGDCDYLGHLRRSHPHI